MCPSILPKYRAHKMTMIAAYRMANSFHNYTLLKTGEKKYSQEIDEMLLRFERKHQKLSDKLY